MPGIRIVRRLPRGSQNLKMEVIPVSSPISIDSLRRAFANDKKALKELQLLREFAAAQMIRKRTESKRATAKRDQVILDLRAALGDEHFQRVVDRIDRLVQKAKEGDTVVP